VNFLLGNHQARHIQTHSYYRVIELIDDGYKIRFSGNNRKTIECVTSAVFKTSKYPYLQYVIWMFNASSNNKSVTSLWWISLLGDIGVPRKNNKSAVCYWQTFTHKVIRSTSYYERNICGVIVVERQLSHVLTIHHDDNKLHFDEDFVHFVLSKPLVRLSLIFSF
jgi:hypothetical protein